MQFLIKTSPLSPSYWGFELNDLDFQFIRVLHNISLRLEDSQAQISQFWVLQQNIKFENFKKLALSFRHLKKLEPAELYFL